MRAAISVLAAAAVGAIVAVAYGAISGVATTQAMLYVLMASGAVIGAVIAVVINLVRQR